jgi:hypothetical protein
MLEINVVVKFYKLTALCHDYVGNKLKTGQLCKPVYGSEAKCTLKG